MARINSIPIQTLVALGLVCLSVTLPTPNDKMIADLRMSNSSLLPIELPPIIISSTSKPNITDKLRQDGDGDGDAGVDGGDLENVAQQVGTIVSGVFGGNIANIFQGATGFIEEEDTQKGVGSILTGIARPLNQLLISSVMSGQKYFGITDPPSILVAATSAPTVAGALALPGGAAGSVAGVPAVAAVNPPVAVAPAITVTEEPPQIVEATTSFSDNDEYETDSDDKQRKNTIVVLAV